MDLLDEMGLPAEYSERIGAEFEGKLRSAEWLNFSAELRAQAFREWRSEFQAKVLAGLDQNDHSKTFPKSQAQIEEILSELENGNIVKESS